MAYSAQVLRMAREELTRQKSDFESLYNHRLHEAYLQVPRLRQIDMQLRQTVTLAAQAAFVKGEDGVAALAEVKKTNLSLQEERKQLLEQNFAPGYLDKDTVCPYCGGVGYVGSTMCSCLKELCRQAQQQVISKLTTGVERFENFRLDYYPEELDPVFKVSPRKLMERTLQVCKKYAENFDGKGNLLFVGGTGLGKTFLSACIANAVADQGYSIAYESASALFDKLNRHHFAPDEQTRQQVDSIQSADLLIIDDLGTEMTNQFVISALYSLLNDRLLQGKSMIISTNLNVEEITRRYSPQIASRVQGCFKALTFLGKDIRVTRGV